MTGSFRVLWAAAASANLSDGIVLTALPLIALTLHASAAEVALVTTMATAAWPLIGLHAGWIVDRVSIGRLLLAVNLARAGVFGLLAWALFAEVATVPTIFLAALAYGVAETLVDTATAASVPRLVPDAALTGANSRLEGTVNALNTFAGPPIAGALLAISAAVAATTGSLLYLFTAIGCLFLLRPLTRSAPPKDPLEPNHIRRARVREGIVFLWHHPVLRSLTAFTAAMNLVWSAWLAVFVMYAVAPGPLGLSPLGYGWLMAVMSVGGLLAALLTPILRKIASVPALLFVDLVGTILLVLPAALGAPLWVIALGIVIAGAGSSVWRILVAVIRQEQTPAHLLGRVYSASRVISWGALPVGSALAALLASWAGIQLVLLVASALAVATAALFLLLRMPSRISALRTPDGATDPAGNP